MRILIFALAVLFLVFSGTAEADDAPDPTRDILVTFDNQGAGSSSAGAGAPYSHRKRYAIARQVQRDATAVASEYSLREIDHWPIRSLSIYCFVYRVEEGVDRESIIANLNKDARVESVQALQSFETSTTDVGDNIDTYRNLQYGLDLLDIAAAHRTTRGAGIRVAIIDSNVEKNHEDLKGRIDRVREFSSKGQSADRNHGTAIASIIGARSNNALGITSVAPEASLELYVSCWSGGAGKSAICDTFSISKSLDALLEDPPDVLNLSLSGPYDPLLERLILRAREAGVVVVAAGSADSETENVFPSTMRQVIGVDAAPTELPSGNAAGDLLFAPGKRILVAVPKNEYDFRSGSSLAAAHVSGVVALILAIAPDSTPDEIVGILRQSQQADPGQLVSINACSALGLAGSVEHCDALPNRLEGYLQRQSDARL